MVYVPEISGTKVAVIFESANNAGNYWTEEMGEGVEKRLKMGEHSVGKFVYFSISLQIMPRKGHLR